MKKYILPIILVQIIIVLLLGFKIISNKKKVVISNIKGESIYNPSASKLKYYYDLVPDRVELRQPNWLEEPVRNTINKDGLNERFNYQIAKPEKTFRIITLGDSFTFGENVDTSDNWTEQLEIILNNKFQCKKYQKFEVINLGVYGYDIEYAVEKYRIKGQKYNPDLIIWMLLDELRVREKIAPLEESCSKELKTEPSININCWEKAREIFVKQVGTEFIDEYLAKHFVKLFSYYDKDVVAINLDQAHSNMLSMIKPTKKLRVFPLQNRGELALPDSHPSKEGHIYIANNVYEYIINNQIIDCE